MSKKLIFIERQSGAVWWIRKCRALFGRLTARGAGVLRLVPVMAPLRRSHLDRSLSSTAIDRNLCLKRIGSDPFPAVARMRRCLALTPARRLDRVSTASLADTFSKWIGLVSRVSETNRAGLRLTKPHTQSEGSNSDDAGNRLVPVSKIKCDAFELNMLPVIRHFLMALSGRRPDAWFLAYGIAAERLGERLGFPVAHALAGIVERSVELLGTHPSFKDPLSADDRVVATEYEVAFLEMVHHMRRDQTPQARIRVGKLTRHRMDPGFIRASLAFAHRHRVGDPAQQLEKKPQLKIVS